jgi:dTDP-4-amino-4,6-dideoxygalactose transaminase
VWHLYTVRVPAGCDRNRVRAILAEQDIETGLHYPRPIHLQPAFASLSLTQGAFPVAESAADRLISLPMHPFLTHDDVHRVVAALETALAAQGAARP